jgi:hypothetical protein
MMDNLGHLMIQTLFPNNDAVFHDNNIPIVTAGTVQSWFEGEHYLLWTAQSPHLNIAVPL